MKNLDAYKKLQIMFGIVSGFALLAIILEITGIVLSANSNDWLKDYASTHGLKYSDSGSQAYISVFIIILLAVFVGLGWLFILKAKKTLEVKSGFLLAVAIVFTILAAIAAIGIFLLVSNYLEKRIQDWNISEDDKTNIIEHIKSYHSEVISIMAIIAIIAQSIASWFAWRFAVNYNKSVGQINI